VAGYAGATSVGAAAGMRGNMHPFKKKSQMTSEEFKTALREAGFGVSQGWIVYVSGKCPGFATLPSFNDLAELQ
jgi:hypothetical protein